MQGGQMAGGMRPPQMYQQRPRPPYGMNQQSGYMQQRYQNQGNARPMSGYNGGQQQRPQSYMQGQDDGDQGQPKKQMQRKTIDYYGATVRGLELRAGGTTMSLKNLPSDPSYTVDVFPPIFVPNEPETSLTTRFIWDAKNKPNLDNVKIIQGHREPVRGLSLSPSDAKFVSASEDQQLKVWDFRRGEQEQVLSGHSWAVRAVDWHPQKGMIVSGGKDNIIKLWDPRTGSCISSFGRHNNSVTSLEWNRNGNWLISGGRDHCIKLFDIRNLKEEVRNYSTEKREIHSIAWHPIHETLFASGGTIGDNNMANDEGTIQFWTTDEEKQRGAIEGAHGSCIWSLDWHPMGHILASGSNDHSTRFWGRPRPGERIPTELGSQDDVDVRLFGDTLDPKAEEKLACFAQDKPRPATAGASHNLWYMGYAAKVLGRPLEYMYNFKLVSTSDFKESGYTLNAPTFIDMTDKMRVGGNLYAKQAAIVTSTSTTGSDKDISSATSSSNLELSATDTSINGTEEPSSSGLSKTLKIIIGAVVPAVVIIAAIIVFLVYHYLRKKQLYDKERSHAEQMHMREIANDLVVDESVQPHAILPPPYSANSDTETIIGRRALNEGLFNDSWGAILVKNSQQTTCEIGLIGVTAGMVAANCLDFTDSGSNSLDPDTSYKAYLYNGQVGSEPMIYTIEQSDIHVHPSYNSSNFAYNMAILEFNKGSTDSTKTYVGSTIAYTEDKSYTQRSLDSDLKHWDTTSFGQEQGGLYDVCAENDSIYQISATRFYCNNATVSSTGGDSCAVPYSAVYMEDFGELVLLALYSHSVILGTDMCSDQWINYYVYTYYFIAYATEVLNRVIDYTTGVEITNSTADTPSPLSLIQNADADLTGKMRVGGDFYAKQASVTSASGSSSSVKSTSTTATDDIARPTTESPEDIGSSGLDTTQKIIIGVVVPVAVIIIIVCVVILYRLWRRRSADRTWQPRAEEMRMREIANELVADEAIHPSSTLPPPYSASAGTAARLGQNTAAETAPVSAPAESEHVVELSEKKD
ncbi:WD repeat-containing protein 33 [Coemansia erecta]|uniref:Polyadenylation factor subunit 2 n=1 Tax=Coemansia erecta TaxID=147472 RepID=A0A9W7XUH0_9FUNG|nr:WD repeat-containing protein 33 [Coemansia erecta]